MIAESIAESAVPPMEQPGREVHAFWLEGPISWQRQSLRRGYLRQSERAFILVQISPAERPPYVLVRALN